MARGTLRHWVRVAGRTGSKVVAEGLRRIAGFYAIEADIRGASPERRLAEHRARTAPLIEDFGVWVRDQRARVSAKSHLREALAYIARYRDGLRVFLEDGRVELDTNAAENRIRPLPSQERTRCSPAMTKGLPPGAASPH